LVRRRLFAGDTDQEVLNYIVARYGVFVLLNPPFESVTWLLWLGPPALVLGAGAILLLGVSRRRRDPRLLDLSPNGPACAEASDSAIP
jgi:cytochrome c-type biogenesis protein CcmH